MATKKNAAKPNAGKKEKTSTKVKAQHSSRRLIEGYVPNAYGFLRAIRDILIEIHEKVCEG